MPCPVKLPWLRIEKRKQTTTGETYYRDRVRIQGLPEKQKTFKRMNDAKLWAQQTEAAIRRGKVTNVITKTKGKTLSDVITRYRQEVLPHKAKNSQRAAESYLKHWDAVLGKYGLSYLTPDLISGEVAKLAQAGDTLRKLKAGETPPKPKSRKTQKRYRDMLAVLLKNAKAWGWMPQNLMDGVNPITNIRDERTRFLSDEERARLLDAYKASDDDKPMTTGRTGVQAAKRRHPTGSKRAAPQGDGIRPTRDSGLIGGNGAGRPDGDLGKDRRGRHKLDREVTSAKRGPTHQPRPAGTTLWGVTGWNPVRRGDGKRQRRL